MFSQLKSLFSSFFQSQKPSFEIDNEHRLFLKSKVAFYRELSSSDQAQFESRLATFIQNTEFIGHDLEVSDEDRLLVASGSVILAWGFDKWFYVRVETVILVSRSFNEHSEFGQEDSNITGLVGTHYMRGKMILSRPALHQGFSIDNDKRNVAIHEFAHLIDMADGEIDGLPREISERAFALPWLEMVSSKIRDIDNKRSDIRAYGATNNAEFFSVVTEYFFERPKRLKRKHPELYQALEGFYQQNRADLHRAKPIKRKAPCPCGSGKRYKRCCEIEVVS